MKTEDMVAVVTGGGSGLGAAVAELLAGSGAAVAVLDLNEVAAEKVAGRIGGRAYGCDVAAAQSVSAAMDRVASDLGTARILVNCAGIAPAQKVLSSAGIMPLDDFRRAIEINLIGTFNVMRLFVERLAGLDCLETGERGVVVNTASIAAFEGQIGQTAYAASKAGVVGLALPAAREFAPLGIRVCTIAPGLFGTPLLDGLPQPAKDRLAENVPFPRRLGKPAEFAALVLSVIGNPMLNGETIRLDGALRMQPR